MTTAAVRPAIPNVFFWTVAPGPKPAIRPAGPVLDVDRQYPAASLGGGRRRTAGTPAPAGRSHACAPARHEQMEQDRTPAVQFYHDELARPSADQLSSHRQPHRSYDHQSGLGGAGSDRLQSL